MRDFSIRFLTRTGCHLCDDARPLVEWATRKAGAGLLEVDIDTDDTLLALYGMRIPVVLVGHDIVVAEGRIDDRRSLRKRISELAGG